MSRVQAAGPLREPPGNGREGVVNTGNSPETGLKHVQFYPHPGPCPTRGARGTVFTFTVHALVLIRQVLPGGRAIWRMAASSLPDFRCQGGHWACVWAASAYKWTGFGCGTDDA